MKRIWFAIGFLTIMVCFCVGEQIYLNNVYRHTNALIAAAEKNPTKQKIDEIQQYWELHNDTLFILFEHSNLDNLAVEIRALDADDEQIKSELEVVKAHNIVFYQNVRASPTNIF